MNNELNFIEIINMLLRRWWLIIIMTIIGASVAFVYTDFFMVPMYKTDGSLYVNCETSSTEIEDLTSSGKLNSSYRLATSYVEILQTRNFLTGVSVDVGNKYTYEQLKGMIEILPINETELLELTVKGTDPEDICEILTSVLSRAPQELIRVVKAGSVEVVDLPYVPTSPYSPSKLKNTALGAVIGMVLSAIAILWIGIFDTHIKTAEQIKNIYEEPLLGEIPSLDEE